jgi:hypothetical protein
MAKFAMKQRFAFLLVILLGLWAFGAVAQDAAPTSDAVYDVADVAVDVTADSAAKAHDQAMAQAQRDAFKQLLQRLGVDVAVAAKLSDDDLATLVKNFEVQNERSSSVRYIGTFTVQFRPTAVRTFLAKRNANFSDAQGKPVVVFPVYKNGDKLVLWEEPTLWRKLWADAAREAGLVPIIVPTGSADDKAALSAADAIAGKPSVIKPLIEKYQANGAIVVMLSGSIDNSAAGFTIDMQHFSAAYDDGSDVEHIVVPGTTDKYAVDASLTDGIHQIRHMVEQEWRQEQKQEAVIATPTVAPTSATPTWNDEPAPSRIPVTVQFNTLPEWADIQRRLQGTAGVRRADVISLGRGETQIELGFAGTPQDLQVALAQHNLRLTQDILSGLWVLRGY